MTETPNNQCASPNAAGGAPQLTADPLPEERNETQQPKKRANVCIATLNVNEAATQSMDHIEKWTIINNTIKNEKLAITALQEMHLDEERLDDINRCFGKNLEIINSSSPSNP